LQDHPKDAEFLNVPIINNHYMQDIFGGGVAMGRFAMGSQEPLGQAPEPETIDLESPRETVNKADGSSKRTDRGKFVVSECSNSGKRKRAFNEDDAALLSGLAESVRGFGAALTEGNNNEAATGIYEAVMDVPGFARADLMVCLNYLMKDKASALVFIQMRIDDKALWLAQHLAEVMAKSGTQ
jgi:hypothetical protein